MMFPLFMHHITFVLYFFYANLQSAFGFVFFSLFILLCVFGPYSSTMFRKTRANRVPSTPSMSTSRSQLFKNNRCHEAFEKLNSKRKIWAECFVILDEVDPIIRANLESRDWLSLLEIDHLPPTALIREFFSNLSCHIYDSNTLVRSWIRGVEFTITPRVVAEALRVPIVTKSVYPYAKSPPVDVVMSHISESSSGVLILESRLLRCLKLPICFLELRVIFYGLFLISTPSLLSDVYFYMLSCLVRLSAFLICFFVL